jgi:branched-chain amino acid transport system ATP-binding protein
MRLEVRGLVSGYGTLDVIRDVDLSVDSREWVALVGAVGAGKSALMGAIAGLLPMRRGRIMVEGEDVSSLAAHERVAHGLALVPEGRRLFAGMTVTENLAAGAFRARREDVQDRLDRLFDLFPVLTERRRQQVGTLSGGEQQMCAIGRALMSGPTLLLIDELSLGLAPIVVDRLLDALIKVRADGTSLLVVDQDVETLLGLADRGYLLRNGRIVRSAVASELLEDPTFTRDYIGVA